MPHLTLAERALAGLRRLIATKRVTQTQVARMAGIPDASMTRIMKGTQPVTFHVLEAAAQLADIEPVDMLIDPIDLRMRLSPDEHRMVRYVRSLPATTRSALLAFLDFYADDDPATQQLREAHEHLRHLKDGPRQRAVAYLLFLRDGGLTPDLRAAFGLPETDEPTPESRRGPKLLKPHHGPKK